MEELTAGTLKDLFFNAIQEWHQKEKKIKSWKDAETLIPFPHRTGENEFLKLAFYLQLINCYQWHEEDKSHREDLPDSILAEIKRRIDRSNERRNAFIDYFDRRVMAWYQTLPAGAREDAPLHSETPGHILDRLTVLALKIRHLSGNPGTDDSGTSKREERRKKLRILEEQWQDLADCFVTLIDEFKKGRRRMKVYTQHKVYDHSAE